VWDKDGEGVGTRVYEVKLLVMDVVVLDAGEPIVRVLLAVGIDQLKFCIEI
jgi:hypothetical protein